MDTLSHNIFQIATSAFTKQLPKPIKAFLEISLRSIPMKGKFLGEY
jgi:hypothetical protein